MNSIYKNDIFGSYQLACECLNDTERTKLFGKAIKKTVKNDDIVIDAGTGTGILSLFALKGGAGKVYAVEITEVIADFAKRSFEENGFAGKSVIINKDGEQVNNLDIPEKADLLLLEMISTGLIEEKQIPVFNHLLREGLVGEKANAIPCRYTTFANLAYTDFDFFGFKMVNILHQEKWQRRIVEDILSKEEEISFIDFNKAIRENAPISEDIDKDLSFKMKKSGIVNSLVIASEAFLTDKIKVGWTTAINIPIIIPIEPIKVKRGDVIALNIAYKMGDGLERLRLTVA